MKPAWDALADSYADSSSVGVFDVDCTVEADLCQKKGVQGYPTIKYYKDGDKEGEKYQSGRDADSLKTFVKENLERPCEVLSGKGCTDKENEYIKKMQAKAGDAIAKELARLEGMTGKSMKSDKKAWLSQRMHILKGLSAKTEL